MLNFDGVLKIKNEIIKLLLSPTARRLLDAAGGKTHSKDSTLNWMASNFVGAGIGQKIKGCESTEHPAIMLLVRVKVPTELAGKFELHHVLGQWQHLRATNSDEFWKALSAEDPGWAELRKDTLNEWAALDTNDNIDVIPTGMIGSQGGLAGPLNQLTIGSDVSMAGRATHGTVGAFVSAHKCRRPLLLSCGHVLDSHCGKFQLVSSRGAVVARIVDQSKLLPGHGPFPYAGQVDAVLAELLPDVDPNFELPGRMGRLSSPTPEHPHCRMRVTKAGKTVTEGKVICTHAAVMVDYPSQVSWLDHQIVVESKERHGAWFAQAGDSGSLVVTRVECGGGHSSEHEASFSHGGHRKYQLLSVGMVVAAGDPATLVTYNQTVPPQCTIVTPMRTILEWFDAELLIS